MKKTKIKRHVKWKTLFFFLLFIATVYGTYYYYFHMPIKNILITGTTTIKDYQIIEASGLKEYPKMRKYSARTIEKNIKKLDLVNDVKVKKNIVGTLSINVEEARVLLYNRNNSTYVLSNGKETIEGEYPGIPFLVNYVKSSVYDRLIKDLVRVKPEALALVSEIEYYPNENGDVVLDETRFLLRMNDGNNVHINLINIDKLNLYALTYTTLKEKGTLYMDSNDDKVWVKNFSESSE